VSGALERFPRIRHIVTHCGGCVPSVANRLIDRRPLVAAYTAMVQRGEAPSIERIEALITDAQTEAAARLGALHYDIALSSDPNVLAALCDLVPPSQLLVGTDFPMGQGIGVHVTLTGLARSGGFSAAERRAVRSTNAGRLFPRLGPANRTPRRDHAATTAGRAS
jgi:predicted TIM-barrel fold metal-dependent hydrolase